MKKTRQGMINELAEDLKNTRITSKAIKKYKELEDITAWLNEQWAKEEDNAWQEEGYVIDIAHLSSCIEISMRLTDDTPYEDTLIGILFWDEMSDEEVEALYNLS